MITIETRNFLFSIVGSILAVNLATLGLETMRENLVGGALVVLGFAYIVGGALYLLSTQGQVPQVLGERSFWFVVPGLLATFLAPPLEYLYGPQILPRNSAMELSGLAVVLAAASLCIWAWRATQGQATSLLQAKAHHPFRQSGPFRFVRHPGYAALVLLALGLCIGYSSMIGLLGIPSLMLPGLAYRMGVEEKLLIEQLGDRYRSYSHRTKRIIPGVW